MNLEDLFNTCPDVRNVILKMTSLRCKRNLMCVSKAFYWMIKRLVHITQVPNNGPQKCACGKCNGDIYGPLVECSYGHTQFINRAQNIVELCALVCHVCKLDIVLLNKRIKLN